MKEVGAQLERKCLQQNWQITRFFSVSFKFWSALAVCGLRGHDQNAIFVQEEFGLLNQTVFGSAPFRR